MVKLGDRVEAPTRREYLKYGGSAVGAGLLAGCTGDTSGGGTTESADGEGTADESYSELFDRDEVAAIVTGD